MLTAKLHRFVHGADNEIEFDLCLTSPADCVNRTFVSKLTLG